MDHNKKNFFFTLLCLILVSVSVPVWAQQTVFLIKDAKTHEPLPYANICFESLAPSVKLFKTSDDKGKVSVNLTGKTIVAVSYVGYESYFDTLMPGKVNEIKMTPASIEVEEYVVTAQYAPVKSDQSIYKVDVINFDQILEKGASNLNDLLATEASFRVSQDGALGSKISLQGLSGEHIKILIDGVPVIGRMDGNIDISQLNLHNVDHVEIIEGPMSVIYGSNALAGAINIITRENKLSRFSISTDAYYESVGIYNLNTRIAGKNGKHYYSATAARNFFEGYDLDKTTRDRLWDPKRQYNADAYYMYDWGKTKLKVSGAFFNEHIRDKGALAAPYFETAFDHYFTTTRYNGRFEIFSKFNNNRFMNLLVAPSWFSRSKITYFKDLTTLEQQLTPNFSDHDTSIFRSILARGTYSKSLPESKLEYQLGYDVNYEFGSGKRILNQEQEIGDFAGFLSVNWSPMAKLSLQPGLRYGYNTRYKAPLIHSLNLKWSPGKDYQIRLSYSRGFRAPSLKELYLYFVDINHNIVGNDSLKAEYSYNINLSAIKKFAIDNHFFELETKLFYNNIHNIITLAQQDATRYSYVNVDEYKTQGGELSVTYKMHPRFTTSVSYVLTGRYNSLSNESPGLADFTYSSDISTNARYKNLKYNFFFTIYYKYFGRMPQFYLDENEDIKEGYIESYHNMDVSFGKYYMQDRLFVSFGAKNLFNNININSSGLVSSGGVHSGGDGSSPVGWGRSAFVRLTYNFNKF